MPSKAPNTPVIENIAGNGKAIVLQTSKSNPDALKWYVRAKGLKNIGQPERALKLGYKAHISQEAEVIRLAEPIVEEWKRRSARNQPARPKTLAKLWEDFKEDAERLYKANEKLIQAGKPPKWQVEQGSGMWSRDLFLQRWKHWETYLEPFWGRRKQYKGKLAVDITHQDIKAWQLWRDEQFPDLAPSTLNKQNTTLRHLFKLAVRQGENFAPPTILDAKPEIQRRRRPIVSFEQMEQVEKYLTDQYAIPFSRDNTQRRYVYPYLLKNYLDLLKFSGIRPWNTKKSAVRMDDIEIIQREGREITILLTRREKAKAESAATVSRRFIKNYDSLNRFYERFGIGEDREFLFVHPKTVGTHIRKGAPILSFKKQWQTMMAYFGWNDNATEGQFEKLSFYSYRHAFITNKLIHNKEISIFELARSTRTSIKMIEQIYGHYLNESRADAFLADDYDYVDTATIYSPTGLEMDSVKTNSKAHWDWWKKAPKQVAFAPIGEEP